MNFRVGTLRHKNENKQSAARMEPGTRQGLLLTVCCVAQFMVILDLSIVNVALPSIQSDLGFTPVNLQCQLTTVTTAAKSGFETAIAVRDAKGKVLGTCWAVRPRG